MSYEYFGAYQLSPNFIVCGFLTVIYLIWHKKYKVSKEMIIIHINMEFSMIDLMIEDDNRI